MRSELRKLPSVDHLLGHESIRLAEAESGHALTLAAAREVLDEARRDITSGGSCPPIDELVSRVLARLAALQRPTLRPVINATGVIVHTNLGRAPLSRAAIQAMVEAAAYSNLEFDLEAGERGSRYVHAEELLVALTGAEAALLVNNDAAAVLLVLTTVARGREVVISRGQLVEIGGGFRIPEVMAQSGAQLVEVGTTNRTYLRDYEDAITERTAALLHVHASNFRLVGFTHEVSLSELVTLGHKQGLLVLEDLGSGALLDTATYGLAHEPTVQECVASGADLVCFSGDKLLGGPQAGVIVGRRELIAKLRNHPMTRAVRVSKVTIAGLQATLLHYRRGEAEREVPVWRMIAMPVEAVQRRAQRLVRRLKGIGVNASVVEGRSAVGGGALPGDTLPTWLVAVTVRSPDDFARALRLGEPAVVGRIEEGRFLLDLRTVLETQDEALWIALRAALGSSHQ